ncbi:MAG TPA: hypothetical protein VJ598_13090 [Albitalea sp.]|nr:hypothetical protein [Albitalea sp.]
MSDAPSPAVRLTLTQKRLLLVLGGIVIGAVVAGAGMLLFIQSTVRAEIEDRWTGQLAALSKAAVDEQIRQRFGSRDPALVKQYHSAGNDCTRINEAQYCWGREAKTPKLDAKTQLNTVEHSFTYAVPFAETPVVTVGLYAARDQKMWVVFSSTRTPTTFRLKAQDISKSTPSEEHVLVSYVAVGTSGKD